MLINYIFIANFRALSLINLSPHLNPLSNYQIASIIIKGIIFYFLFHLEEYQINYYPS